VATAHSIAREAVPTAVRETLRRPVGWAAWVPVAALTIAFAAGVSIPRTWRYVPLAASVAVFGLPHGAADWVALPRAVADEITVRLVALVCLLYVVLGAAYALAWLAVPLLAAVGFVVLTWLHWGQGDIHPLRVVFGMDHLESRPLQALTVVVRGGLPMLVPLLAFPDRYRTIVAAFVAPFGGSVSAWPGPQVRLWLGVAFGALTVMTLAWGLERAHDRHTWGIDAGEAALLWAFFLTVPPVLAIGVYFCLWHSLRHVARVLTLDYGLTDSLARGRLRPALTRFAIETAVPTAVALAIGGGLWVLAPDPQLTARGLTAIYLVAIAVLTLPHVVVVTWLDRAQGLW